MEPGKLKAYMDSKGGESVELDDAALEGESITDDEAFEGEESEEGDEVEVVDEEGFAEFLDALFEVREALSVAAGEVAAELVHESQPDGETVEQMKEQLAEMPAKIQEGVADFVKGMEYEDVVEMVEEMSGDEDLVEDPMQVAGWLYWVAKNV
jgi:hypothetical protein